MKKRRVLLLALAVSLTLYACTNPLMERLFGPETRTTPPVVINPDGPETQIDPVLVWNEEDFGPEAVIEDPFTVATTTEWNNAVSLISGGESGSAGNNKNYIINVIADFDVAGTTTNTFGSASGITVSLRGDHKLTLTDTGNLIRTGENQTVVLRDLTLQGHNSNTTSVVNVAANGTFTMQSGEIKGNTFNNGNGGGVNVAANGTFTMNGGKISGNASNGDNNSGNGRGGGVFVAGSGATFTMNNGEISGNTAVNNGSGVYVRQGASFTMNGGEISGNTATNGGGVYVRDGSFTMKGGKISGNTATTYGGGVAVQDAGIFKLYGGEISGNTAGTNNGGGVYVYTGGTFTMTGGKISGNRGEDVFVPSTATLSGNAVIGNLTLEAATASYASITIDKAFTGNVAALNLYGNDSIDTVINLWENKQVIKGGSGYTPTASDIGRFTLGKFLCTTAADNRDITGNATGNNYRIGTSDADMGKLVNISNEEDFGVGATIDKTFNVANEDQWNAAKSDISDGGPNKNYVINVTADLTVAGISPNNTFTAIYIKVSLRGVGRTLTLSGNGNLLRIGTNQTVILRDLTLQGRNGNSGVVYITGAAASFTMRSGKISGNTNSGPAGSNYGGGVYVASNGTFAMHGGEISGNKAVNDGGGGVYVANNGTFTMHGGKISGNETTGGGGVLVGTNGTFTMNGGEISGNTVTSNTSGGGGVYTTGTFTMHGGEISNNKATGNGNGSGGGGVYVYTNGTFTMHGGEISKNTTGNGGGGVLVGNTGTFTMNGGEISGNTAALNGGGVYMSGGASTMHGGEISGNTAATNGGGVYVTGNNTIFKIVKGTIYGSNETNTSLKNTAVSGTGAALFVNSGTATYGPNGTGTDLTTPSDNTIRVVNGVMQ